MTLRLDEAVHAELSEAARAERRSLANLIETAAVDKVREKQFADDAEMAVFLTAASHRGSAY